MENKAIDKNKLYPWLIWGGIFAAINTIISAIFFHPWNPNAVDLFTISTGTIIFYAIFSISTLLSGILLKQSKRTGYYLLWASLILLVLSLFLRIDNMYPTFIVQSIFFNTLAYSFLFALYILIPPFIVGLIGLPVLIFTIISTFSIIFNFRYIKFWNENTKTEDNKGRKK